MRFTGFRIQSNRGPKFLYGDQYITVLECECSKHLSRSGVSRLEP